MDLVTDVGIETAGLMIGFNFLFKLLFLVLLILYVAYSYFLALRIRIIADTVRTPWNKSIERLAFFHLYAVILVGLLAVFFIFIA